jgi:NAD+ kinase
MKQLNVQDSTLSRDLACMSNSSSSTSSSRSKAVAVAADGGTSSGGGGAVGDGSVTGDGGALQVPGNVLGTGWLRTWVPEVDGEPYIPQTVASQLDLVVVLGGDGTVLWTCHIFGNRSVPPLVPFNLGSLGFLTPFVPTSVKGVLAKCLRGGFPIQLRHRLHCSIVRGLGVQEGGGGSGSSGGMSGGSSSSSRVTWDGLPKMNFKCADEAVWEGDEHVALNEVVLDRGSSPFLTNLECYCNGNFVTHVQVSTELGIKQGGRQFR